MPNFSATLIELLTYIAPGLVVLYSMRSQFPEIDKLISGLNTARNFAPTIPLLLFALATGVILAGISSLFLALAIRIPSLAKQIPQKVNFAALFKYRADQLAVLRHNNQTDQAYGSMALALVISFVVIIIRTVAEGQRPEHWLGLTVNGLFCIGMVLASIRFHFRHMQFLAELSKWAERPREHLEKSTTT